MQDQGGEFVVQIRLMDWSEGDALLLHPCLECLKRFQIGDGEDDEKIGLVVPAATEVGLCGGEGQGRVDCLSSLEARLEVGSGDDVELFVGYLLLLVYLRHCWFNSL